MITYNVTVQVDNAILEEWLVWIENHMPQVVATGCFESSAFFELLEPKIDENRTFVIQYLAKNLENYEDYIKNHSTELRQEGIEKFGDQMSAFRSILKKIG